MVFIIIKWYLNSLAIINKNKILGGLIHEKFS